PASSAKRWTSAPTSGSDGSADPPDGPCRFRRLRQRVITHRTPGVSAGGGRPACAVLGRLSLTAVAIVSGLACLPRPSYAGRIPGRREDPDGCRREAGGFRDAAAGFAHSSLVARHLAVQCLPIVPR